MITTIKEYHDNAKRILVVDTDSEICTLLMPHFGNMPVAVDFCDDIDELSRNDLSAYDLVFIDLNLNDVRTLSIVESLKQRQPHIGIITCSQSMSPETIIEVLNAGADDYLLKPFSARELQARVNAVLRRRPR